MNEIYFENVNDLYNRLKPALRSKVKEIKVMHKININEEDIFMYLSENKWNKSNDLSLYDMVDDILYLNNDLIIDYIANKINNKEMMKDERNNI